MRLGLLLPLSGALSLLPPALALAPCAAGPGPRNSTLVQAVIHGMEARERLVRSELRTLKGLWIVRERNPAAPESGAPPPVGADTDSQPSGPPEAGVVEAPRPPYTKRRVYVVFDDERYRQSIRVLEPDEERLPYMMGYDGRVAWSGRKEFRKTRRLPVYQTRGARLLGLADVLPTEPEYTLTWRMRALQPRSPGQESVGGRLCYVVRYGPPEPQEGSEPIRHEFTAWVCPELGYAVVRLQHMRWKGASDEAGAGRASRSCRELSDFRRYSQGLWLPHTYSYTEQIQQADGTWRTTFSRQAQALELKLNIPIPAQEFERPGPM